ncbi:MAG TPA: hypothetical protein VHE55_11100 [Fimbriimonadaceae bacterium]|nr:hypothetical protein [Fimbriimonadaceae bacterium]
MRELKVAAAIILVLTAACANASYIKKRLTTNKKGVWKGYVEYCEFKGDTPLIRLANAQILKEAKADIASFIDDVNNLETKGESVSELEGSCWVELETPALISVRLGDARWPARYHPNFNTRRINVALVNGKPKVLTIKDIVRDPKKLLPVVAKSLVAGGKGDEPYKPLDFGIDDLQFLIHPKGLYFFFAQGEIATAYVGPLFGEVPWRKVPGLRRDGPLRTLLSKK